MYNAHNLTFTSASGLKAQFYSNNLYAHEQ